MDANCNEEKRIPILEFENAKLLFRNFSGKVSRYNPDGKRNFCVMIEDEEQAQALAEDKWNVKPMRKYDENEPNRYYLPVEVRYNDKDGAPSPKIFMISGKKGTRLDEESVGELDYADIISADILINPSKWHDDKTGENRVKAYLKVMYVTIEEDRFASKYADILGDEECEDDDEALPF